MKSNCFLYFILFCGLLLFSPISQAQELTTAEAEAFALEQGNNLLAAFAEKTWQPNIKSLTIFSLTILTWTIFLNLLSANTGVI